MFIILLWNLSNWYPPSLKCHTGYRTTSEGYAVEIEIMAACISETVLLSGLPFVLLFFFLFSSPSWHCWNIFIMRYTLTSRSFFCIAFLYCCWFRQSHICALHHSFEVQDFSSILVELHSLPVLPEHAIPSYINMLAMFVILCFLE